MMRERLTFWVDFEHYGVVTSELTEGEYREIKESVFNNKHEGKILDDDGDEIGKWRLRLGA